jgi:proteasome lid subunit RPN8/RPN11
MDIVVTSDVIATLIAEAARAIPAEACGLLLGQGRRIIEARPAANVAEDPVLRFEIDPAALFAAHREARSGGPHLLGYYHSHPAGHPRPSATDCEHASGDARTWAIVSGEEVTFWRDGESGFESLSYCVADG